MTTATIRPTTLRRTFTQEELDAFGYASGGAGHIHTDPEFAAATPFGRTLVQGLLLLAVVERAIETALPDPTVGWAELRVVFVAPVGVGDEFRVEIAPADAPGLVRVEAFAGSTTALVGTATIREEPS
jgi:3-hydroxybutyryl-CoA dehydratase